MTPLHHSVTSRASASVRALLRAACCRVEPLERRVLLASIAGTVFEDTNGDAVQNSGERGVSGVTVFVDANRNTVLDAGEATDTTDTNGVYSFTGLVPGAYRVVVVPPSGFINSNNGTGIFAVTLSGGEVNGGGDFGLIAQGATVAGISGVVYNDTDRDGTRDAGENSLQNVRVFLDTNGDGGFDNGEPFAQTSVNGTFDAGVDTATTTDGTGTYFFRNLAAGTYKVYLLLAAGETRTGIDFGNLVP